MMSERNNPHKKVTKRTRKTKSKSERKTKRVKDKAYYQTVFD